MKGISQFKNNHAGSDIWVIGSGASLNYVSPEFFLNKITVGLNNACTRFPVKYAVCHHFEDIWPNVKRGILTMAPKHDQGFPDLRTIDEWVALKPPLQAAKNLFYYDHGPRSKTQSVFLETDNDNMLAVGTGVLTEGLSFAAHLGAKNIIVCGVDLGFLDDKCNFEGYNAGIEGVDINSIKYTHQDYSVYREGAKMSVDYFRARGISVHSLNPFVGFHLEGHKYV